MADFFCRHRNKQIGFREVRAFCTERRESCEGKTLFFCMGRELWGEFVLAFCLMCLVTVAVLL